jgi:hypothetical protein
MFLYLVKYNDYPSQRMLLFRLTGWNNILLKKSVFTDEIQLVVWTLKNINDLAW